MIRGGYTEDGRLYGCEHYELWRRIDEAGLAGSLVPEALARYRRRRAHATAEQALVDTYYGRTRGAALTSSQEGAFRQRRTRHCTPRLDSNGCASLTPS